jgi:hypothetical protein
MNKLFISCLLFLGLLSACSLDKKGLYQDYQKDPFSCDKQPVQYREECFKQIHDTPSYEDYQNQRKELLKK